MFDEKLKGYEFEKEIGKGAFANVILATKMGTGEKFAIKRIDKSYINDKRYKKYLNNEIFILNNLNHPNTIKYYGMKMGMNYIYLIFEFCNGGDLQSCLKQYLKKYNKPFSQEIVQHIMRQVISGFVYIHSRKILHRDIKLENVLVKFKTEDDKENLNMLKTEIKITDFGFARYLKADSLAKSILGNPINMAPNILRKMARIENDTEFGYDEKADIWSLGTITYELLVGCPAFEANSYEDLISKVSDGKYKIPHEITLSKEALSFLNGMLRYDPKSRLSVEELSKQFFLTRPVSTFRNVALKQQGIDPTQSIVMSSKDNINISTMIGVYEGVDISKYDPNDTVDNKSICKIENGKRINEEPTDVIGKEIEKCNIDNQYKIEEKKKDVNEGITKYLHEKFDEMNKDCFYIEPLLIPTQPTDNYNSFDPISKFMDTL